MAKKRSGIWPLFWVSVATILVMVLIAFGAFDRPVVFLSGGETGCPAAVLKTFDLKFINTGSSAATVTASVSSPNVVFLESVESIRVPPDLPSALKLGVKGFSVPEGGLVRVDLEWSYYVYLLWQKKESVECFYKKNPLNPLALVLVE